MRYLAIEIRGQVHILNDRDELGGLIDCDIEHRTLGEVCDDQEYGDRCNTDCPLFRSGTCTSTPIQDVTGNLWHLKKNN